jgi:hypothetical protein
MIREDRKNELRKLAYNQCLQQQTYYLINKQLERINTSSTKRYLRKNI